MVTYLVKFTCDSGVLVPAVGEVLGVLNSCLGEFGADERIAMRTQIAEFTFNVERPLSASEKSAMGEVLLKSMNERLPGYECAIASFELNQPSQPDGHLFHGMCDSLPSGKQRAAEPLPGRQGTTHSPDEPTEFEQSLEEIDWVQGGIEPPPAADAQALEEARILLDNIANFRVNPNDEAGRWLNKYGRPGQIS